MRHPLPRRSPASLVLAAALATLAGCAEHSDYPSLAPRAVEAPLADPAAPASATGPRADAALDARAAALLDQAQAGYRSFSAAADQGCTRITAGIRAPSGSEAWIGAQQLLSGLDAARAAVAGAAADLDQLVIERATAEGQAADLTRLLAAQATVSALAEAQQARIVALNDGRCAAG
jgi:hypothetical protein